MDTISYFPSVLCCILVFLLLLLYAFRRAMRRINFRRIRKIALLLVIIWVTCIGFFVLIGPSNQLLNVVDSRFRNRESSKQGRLNNGTQIRRQGQRGNIGKTTGVRLFKLYGEQIPVAQGAAKLDHNSSSSTVTQRLKMRQGWTRGAVSNAGSASDVINVRHQVAKGVVFKTDTSGDPQDELSGDVQDKGKMMLLRHLAAEKKYYTLRKTKVNLIEEPFIISPGQLCDAGSPFLLIVIPSVPNHFNTRQTIRETVGLLAKENKFVRDVDRNRKMTDVSVKLMFAIGQDGDQNTDMKVKNESRLHGDILQAEFVDSYFKLTKKMLLVLKWVSLYCAEIEYLLKSDEDVFVNVPLLVEYLEKFPPKLKGSIHGYMNHRPSVRRLGKWAVKFDEYPLSQYPDYMSGNSYVISGNIVPRMCMVAEYLPYMPIEDAFITGVLAKVIETNLIPHDAFTYWIEPAPEPCNFVKQKKITANKVSSVLMQLLLKAVTSYKITCGS